MASNDRQDVAIFLPAEEAPAAAQLAVMVLGLTLPTPTQADAFAEKAVEVLLGEARLIQENITDPELVNAAVTLAKALASTSPVAVKLRVEWVLGLRPKPSKPSKPTSGGNIPTSPHQERSLDLISPRVRGGFNQEH